MSVRPGGSQSVWESPKLQCLGRIPVELGGLRVTCSSAFPTGCSGKLGQFVVLLSRMHKCCITSAWGPAVTWESAELKPPQHPHIPLCWPPGAPPSFPGAEGKLPENQGFSPAPCQVNLCKHLAARPGGLFKKAVLPHLQVEGSGMPPADLCWGFLQCLVSVLCWQ